MKEIPHCDTLNYYLEKLSPSCLSDVRRHMVKNLIRNKSFYKGRLLGKYWRVIIDGTGLFYFREKHCENCLVTKVEREDGKKETRYYHKVLEAKLILSEKIVISLGTEFIENESEDVSKNDCELNAAKRLLKRIKKEYPRLMFCIQGDALYAAESIMELCRKNHWEYVLTQKETRQPLLEESYEWIKEGNGGEEVSGIGKERGQGYFVNHVEEMVEAGRGRWKIENEGFNNQKNGIYNIEHLNSYDSTAMKNHYLITQIADILMQLYLSWNPLIRELGQSKKNTSSRLLESFRRQTVTDEDVSYITRYTTVYLE